MSRDNGSALPPGFFKVRKPKQQPIAPVAAERHLHPPEMEDREQTRGLLPPSVGDFQVLYLMKNQLPKLHWG